jgi:hypothetical protein
MSNISTLFAIIVGTVLCVAISTWSGQKKQEGLSGFFMFLGFISFVFLVGYYIYMCAGNATSGSTFEKPDAVVRTNYVTTIIYGVRNYVYTDAKFYTCPQENIFIEVIHGTNSWGSSLSDTYRPVITNMVAKEHP